MECFIGVWYAAGISAIIQVLGAHSIVNEKNWPTVDLNLWREREKWKQMVIVLGIEWEDKRTVENSMWQWYKRCSCLGWIHGW